MDKKEHMDIIAKYRKEAYIQMREANIQMREAKDKKEELLYTLMSIIRTLIEMSTHKDKKEHMDIIAKLLDEGDKHLKSIDDTLNEIINKEGMLDTLAKYLQESIIEISTHKDKKEALDTLLSILLIIIEMNTHKEKKYE